MRARFVVVLAGALFAGCVTMEGPPSLVVGTTTTLQDARLLDALLPAFERDTGIRAKPIVGGTGEVIEKAKRGDVGVLLTHSPARERALVKEGWALARTPVMHDRFVIAGPASDPADVGHATSASDALARIHAGGFVFVSRGDKSGTHEKELALWAAAGLDVATFERARYKQTGNGQGATLLYAAERDAYTLTDEATLLRFHAEGQAGNIRDLSGADVALRNEYAVTELDPARVRGVDAHRARMFTDWLAGARGQALIADYEIDGKTPFTPEAQPGREVRETAG